MTDELDTLARGIAGDTVAQPLRYVTGVVADDAPLTVTLNASGVSVPAGAVISGALPVGAAVACIWDGPSLVVIGRLESAAAAWATVTFNGGWSNFSTGTFGSAAYRRDGEFVHMAGLVATTAITPPASICTLPSGYRPTKTLMFACPATTASTNFIARVDVEPTGNVQFTQPLTFTWPGSTAVSWLSLAPIIFPINFT